MASLKELRKRYYARGKKAVRSVADQTKDIGRKHARYLARAAPYVTAGVAGAAGLIPVPVLREGAVLAAVAAGAGIGRYSGATAARAKGERGREARAEGRKVMRRAAIAGAVGGTLGLGTTYIFGSPFAAASASPSAVSQSATAGSTLTARQALTAGAALQAVPGIGPAGALGAAMTTYTAPAVAAGAGGASLFSVGTLTTVLGVGKSALDIFDKLKKPTGDAQKQDDAPGDIIVIPGAGGGAGGSLESGEASSAPQAEAGLRAGGGAFAAAAIIVLIAIWALA